MHNALDFYEHSWEAPVTKSGRNFTEFMAPEKNSKRKLRASPTSDCSDVCFILLSSHTSIELAFHPSFILPQKPSQKTKEMTKIACRDVSRD